MRSLKLGAWDDVTPARMTVSHQMSSVASPPNSQFGDWSSGSSTLRRRRIWGLPLAYP
jgi:hypothetical protein